MGKKKRDNTIIEQLMEGVVNKKMKIVPKDPFEGKYGEVEVDVANYFMGQILDMFFNSNEIRTFNYQITKFSSMHNGVSKTLFGETLFEEECRVSFTMVYEKGKKDEMIEMIKKKLPDCSYIIKKE